MILDLTLTTTPFGPMALYGLGDDLVGVTLDSAHGADQRHEQLLARHLGAFTTRQAPDAAGAASRLLRYFAGDLGALAEQPLRLLGTDFQRRCWEVLRTVPPGRTVSYSELARMMDQPRAVRAVAAANGANPLPLFVPCHRVIAADGTLWGYAGGLPLKQRLLDHEGARLRRGAQTALAL